MKISFQQSLDARHAVAQFVHFGAQSAELAAQSSELTAQSSDLAAHLVAQSADVLPQPGEQADNQRPERNQAGKIGIHADYLTH